MKFLLIFTISALTIYMVHGVDLYTDRYDNIDVDEILKNRRLLVPYIKCILGQGRCTAEGKELKIHVKEAMQNSCEKCTEAQKKGARRVVKHIRANEKAYWEELLKQYDPDDIYKETYENFLAIED